VDTISPLGLAAIVVVVLLFLGFVNNLMQGWAKKRGAMNKPMSITLYTQKSPAELNQEANAARGSCALFWIAIVLVGWLILLYLIDKSYKSHTMSV
jgi:lysylphosphatidylglycerol synthetase-like protein (DUF2156 family)